jgi:hypothetical protein
LRQVLHGRTIYRVFVDLDSCLVKNSPSGTPFECPFCFLSAQDPLCSLLKWIIPADKLETGKTYWLNLNREDLQTVLSDPACRSAVAMHEVGLPQSLHDHDSRTQAYWWSTRASPSPSVLSTQAAVSSTKKTLKSRFPSRYSKSVQPPVWSSMFATASMNQEENSTIPDQPYYIFGVAMVRLLNQASLLQQVIESGRRGLEAGRCSILQYFKQLNWDINSIQISEEKLTGTCPLSSVAIEYPGKVGSL